MATLCYVIAGPLGVGKTTAVLNLLKSWDGAGDTAVIVNDFGQTGLDAEILRESNSEVEIRNIRRGCLCCSSILDLGEAIAAVRERPELRRILIEPSGLVIMPDFLHSLRELGGEFSLELKPVVALLNPKRTKESHYKSLPFFGTLVNGADILVANRMDQCGEKDREHFREWTARLDPPKLAILETSFGRLPSEIFEPERRRTSPPLKFYPPHSHDEHAGGFAGEVPTVSEKVFKGRIREWITHGIGGVEIIRFKATLPTDGGWKLFEIAEGALYGREMTSPTEAKLDWISRGEISEETMRRELDSCASGTE